MADKTTKPTTRRRTKRATATKPVATPITPARVSSDSMAAGPIALPPFTGKVTLPGIIAYAREQILEQAPKVIPGEQKMLLVIDQVVRWVDDQIDYPKMGVAGKILDSVDHIVLKAILKIIVQHAYNDLAGKRLIK